MTAVTTTGVTLDTGALLALDHPSRAVIMQARLDEVRRRGGGICIPTVVVAQAWRDPRQARLARFIKSPDIDFPMITRSVARAIGAICASTGHHDIVDVHVAWCARERNHAVITSDPQDISRIDATLRLIRA